MNTFEAIFSRRSVRSFLQERLEWEVIEELLEYANKLPALKEGIAVEFKLVSNIEAKQGFYGSVKAPYYLCISSEEKDGYLQNAGYLMEQICLYLTRKGLGSCFLGAYPGWGLKKTMKYNYVVALAFGKAKSELYRDSSKAKRLPEDDVVVYKEEVSHDLRQILTAARLAPSAMNGQPWRFVVYKNRIHVFARKDMLLGKVFEHYKMVDMGIMLANLLLAAEELWVDVALTESEAVKNKPFQKNNYVCTITISTNT